MYSNQSPTGLRKHCVMEVKLCGHFKLKERRVMVDVWVHCETEAQVLLRVWRTALPIERAGPCLDVAMGTSHLSINYKLREVFGWRGARIFLFLKIQHQFSFSFN